MYSECEVQLMEIIPTGLYCQGYTGCVTGNSFTLSNTNSILSSGAASCLTAQVDFTAMPPHTHASAGALTLGINEAISGSDITVDPGVTLAMGTTRDSVHAVTLQGTWKISVKGDLGGAGQYGQLLSDGGVRVGGTLAVTSLASVPPGSVLTIIENRSGGGVAGTFAGLPEGTKFVAGVNRFQISYFGGINHNNVTLTSLGITGGSVQDMWWAGGAENGWGMSIVQHDGKLFVVIYAYDDAGLPTWYVLPAGTWNSDNTVFSGQLYFTHGTPYYAYDAGLFDPGQGAGRASITFHDANHATLSYVIHGIAGTKEITRQLFGPPADFKGTDRADMWWGGANQNGWGIPIIRQNATYFMVWFTYDGTGAPTWFVMPVVNVASDGTLSGRVYRTTGSAWLGQPYDASKLHVTDAGSFTLSFVGDTGTLSWNVDGHSLTVTLDQQKF